MVDEDSIVVRAQRVQHAIDEAADPAAVQVAVGGPCPDCGGRVEVTVHADSVKVRCASCGHQFPSAA